MEAQMDYRNQQLHIHGFSLIEAVIAMALGATAMMAMIAAMQLGNEQLRLLESQQIAGLVARNFIAYTHANPEADYRWHGGTLSSASDCMRATCDPQSIAAYELHHAHSYLRSRIPDAQLRVSRKNNLYHLRIGAADQKPLVEIFVEP